MPKTPHLDFSFFWEMSPYYIHGAQVNVLYSFFTVILGTILGVLIAIMRRTDKMNPLHWFAVSYIEVIRGTPMLVQMYIVRYGLALLGLKVPQLPFSVPLIGQDVDLFVKCLLALAINSSAYVAEIVRSGIQAVDPGQAEAARSLGLSGTKTMARVILPQAIRNILPALGNEFVVVINESAIISVVGVLELMYNAEIVHSITFRPFESLLIAAGIYFLMTFTLSKLLGLVERRMRRSER